ncbi:alpha/beta-Hydrolases superfamily protein [Rhynchospora pubera]|uniref:Alpha/beta-Hydrolases superfamily protein n=1 Tax=Rhynchospora pubera TaxID=906938 RepID=A0AAV8FY94_9POAL|nr:alpha/beta-Hydrolases superfamily protein [Rhynchospora pubera]
MPTVAVKLYSVFFKLVLKHRLQSLLQSPTVQTEADPFGITCRADESTAPANPSFSAADGVATKDIHIDPLSSLSVRIFLPSPELTASAPAQRQAQNGEAYQGYLPSINGVGRQSKGGSRKLPLIVQFHGGGFVMGSNISSANDFFCRRIAKACDAMVVAVGYRLAPESRYPAAFDDGVKVLQWLGKQSNLASIASAKGVAGGGGAEGRIVNGTDPFGTATVEPWLAAHADPSRCVLLGVSCGANVANHVACRAVESGKQFEPVKVVAQVLMYPFFIGSVPTHSELRLGNSYFYDKAMSVLSWKLFLPDKEFDLDHPAANPLVLGRGPPLKCMPPTLTVVAEHDWMRDRAIAYSEELRKVNVDAPVLDYKDAVHEFASLDMLLRTPQAQACAEDIAIWVKKYISIRGHEFSY